MAKRKESKFWNKDQESIVIKHYAHSTAQEMRDLLDGVFDTGQINRKANYLGVHKSDEYLERHGFRGTGRFVTGLLPWNKGKPFPSVGRAIETQFKPGSAPPNHKPVGTIRTTKDGYLEIKIEEGINKWRLLHRETWKQHHGEYPPTGTALRFRDGNKQNCCDINNLELITRKQLLQQNSVHNYPENLRKVIRLKAVLTRKINGN